MKNNLHLLVTFFCQVFLIHPSYSVYLNYEDESGSKIRTIVVDFQTRADNDENSKRVDEFVNEKGYSFTKKEMREHKKILFPNTKHSCTQHYYTLQEKDFFTSNEKNIFIKWIQEAQVLKSLQFLGVDEAAQVTSVEQALKFIALERELAEFDFMPGTVAADEEPEASESTESPSKKPLILPDLSAKLKGVSIICKGKKEKEAQKKVIEILEGVKTYVSTIYLGGGLSAGRLTDYIYMILKHERL
jgi:hypothetical protein